MVGKTISGLQQWEPPEAFHVGLLCGIKHAKEKQEQAEHVNAQARPPVLKPGAHEAREDCPSSAAPAQHRCARSPGQRGEPQAS